MLSTLLVAAVTTVALASGTHRSAGAECKRPAGKPIYRQQREPLPPPPPVSERARCREHGRGRAGWMMAGARVAIA